METEKGAEMDGSYLDPIDVPTLRETADNLGFDPNVENILRDLQFSSFDKRLQTRVFSGPCADVYRAEHRTCGAVVALKVVEKEDERPPHSVEAEVELLAQFRRSPEFPSAGIIPLLGAWRRCDEFTLVMPFFPYTLEDIIKYNTRQRFPLWDQGGKIERANKLPVSRAMDILHGICIALQFVHSRGIIHRDVKPANVLFASYDSPPVLADFGIAWSAGNRGDESDPSSKYCDVSTTIYRAPELLLGMRNYTEAIDVWSLGILACGFFTRDAEPVLGPYTGDIGLLTGLFRLLGPPSIESWPALAHSDAFKGLVINKDMKPELPVKVPRAPDNIIDELLKPMLIYNWEQRITVDMLLKVLEKLINEL